MLFFVPVVIDGEEYMDRAELAGHLGVQPDTVSSWANRGKIPSPVRRIGRSPLWLVSDIETWEKGRPGKGRNRSR